MVYNWKLIKVLKCGILKERKKSTAQNIIVHHAYVLLTSHIYWPRVMCVCPNMVACSLNQWIFVPYFKPLMRF